MLVKLAATKIDSTKRKKFELKWDMTQEHRGSFDDLYAAFTELYDKFSQDSSKEKEFSIMIGGKSFRINPKKYCYIDKELKEEIERRVTKD